MSGIMKDCIPTGPEKYPPNDKSIYLVSQMKILFYFQCGFTLLQFIAIFNLFTALLLVLTCSVLYTGYTRINFCSLIYFELFSIYYVVDLISIVGG